MFVPSTFHVSMGAALFSMCCWGSWSNTLKATESHMRFEAYYINFSLGTVLTSVVAGITLGMVKSAGPGSDATYADDFMGKPPARYAYAFGAGLVFNVANLCLCKGIGMLGLALAFPLCIGTALVLGTLITYAVAPSGSFGLLVLGVILAFTAVCQAAFVQHLKDTQRAAKDIDVCGLDESEVSSNEGSVSTDDSAGQSSDQPGAKAGTGGPSFTRKVTVCIIGGVLMSLWNPLVTLAEKDGGLSAYGEMTFYTLAVALSSYALVPAILTYPLEGGPSTPLQEVARHYCSLPAAMHGYSLLGGIVWCMGTLANAIAGSSGQLSSAESYGIGQCANMIAILWGAFYFKEFHGTSLTVKLLIVLICCFYASAITCIAAASS